MFCTEPVLRKARVLHKCTWCGGGIRAGELYTTWRNVDDAWFTNKMHPECLETHQLDGGEYNTFDNERPHK
jgi:hypothetical protein